MTRPVGRALATRLVQLGRSATGLINPPVERGSTVSFATMEGLRDSGRERYEQRLSYGIHGTGTHFALADAVAAIEGGTRCQIVGSGLSAITTPLLALLSAGDHLLVSDSIYGPSRRFCDGVLRRFAIETTYFDPNLPAASLEPLFRPNTRLLLTESPGSNTFEMQDLRALAEIAHRRSCLLALDNTWAFSLLRPFEHGVDLSLVALTKYASGHSDIILGAVTVADEAVWRRLKDATIAIGDYASPDDCWLALRGIRTIGVRLAHQSRSALEIARFLAGHRRIATVLHPALPGAPGHALWLRDYAGASASLFAVEFAPGITASDVDAFVDRLALFGKGWSWGGYESLATTVSGNIARTHALPWSGALCRFHVGLEEVAELIADLSASLDRL